MGGRIATQLTEAQWLEWVHTATGRRWPTAATTYGVSGFSTEGARRVGLGSQLREAGGRKGSPAKETMSAKTKFVLYVATVLGMASAALAMPQHPTHREAGSTVQRQVASSACGSEGFASAPDQSPRMTATYFDPSPAPFKAYTYSASVRLNPSTSKRIWHGELSFPAFSATPTVSVQIVSSISAVPMQVKSLKMVENPGPSGPVETQMIVEAEPIFDGTASGVYFANLVVTGVPVAPPTSR